MNAEEIRAIRGTVGVDGMARELTVQELFSREIAAHLAELNQQFNGEVKIDRNKTAIRIVESTDGEYSQAQAARIVDLVINNRCV